MDIGTPFQGVDSSGGIYSSGRINSSGIIDSREELIPWYVNYILLSWFSYYYGYVDDRSGEHYTRVHGYWIKIRLTALLGGKSEKSNWRALLLAYRSIYKVLKNAGSVSWDSPCKFFSFLQDSNWGSAAWSKSGACWWVISINPHRNGLFGAPM
jgi:hypothetical protein